MAQTTIPFGSPLAVKRWASKLAIEVNKKSYFSKKFIGKNDNAVIQQLTDLDNAAGDKVAFDLSVNLRNKPTVGDNRLEGNEENLRFYQDEIYIDQIHHGVSAGGRMTRKRTVHNLREVARARLSEHLARWVDELTFIYLSGARGINQDFIEDLAYAGHAGNPVQAPDPDHQMFAGGKVKNTITATDKISRNLIEAATVKARIMQALNPDQSNMAPTNVNGDNHYVLVMSPYQMHDLRNDNASGWMDIQKAAAAAEGRNNPIFKGGAGMINNVVLHEHESVIRFDDYGSGGNVLAARALFLGRQAGAIAYGSSGGMRFAWAEEMHDYGNEPVVSSGMTIGIKKTRFNNQDFGVLAIDTAAAPSA